MWHRDPDGVWTFYATTPGPQSCSRYFSSATPVDPVVCDIESRWVTPWSLAISIAGVLDWRVDVKTTPATRLMSIIGSRMPARGVDEPQDAVDDEPRRRARCWASAGSG